MPVIATTLLVYLAAVAAVFGTQFAAVIALMARRGGTFDPERDGLAALLVSVPASSLALIAIAWLAAGRPRRERLRLLPSRVSGAGPRRDDRGNPRAEPGARVARDPGWAWAPAPTSTGSRGPSPRPSPAGLLLAILVIGGLAPVGEELFFRGFMLTRLRRVWSAGPAILVTAIAFGVIHGEWVHGVLATGIGIYLGAGHGAIRQRDPRGDLPRGQQRGPRWCSRPRSARRRGTA